MVVIEAFNCDSLVEKINISIYEYYDGDVKLIDDNDYRKDKHINKIIISIYSDDANTDLDNKSMCLYDEDGKYSSDKVLFEKQI